MRKDSVKSSYLHLTQLEINGLAGGDNKLELFLGNPPEPSTNVRCYGSVDVRAFVSSCQSIMDRMSFSSRKSVFGKRGDVGVEVELPYTWHSSEQLVVRQRCANP